MPETNSKMVVRKKPKHHFKKREKPAVKNMPAPGPTDMHRWFLYDEGMTVEQIATLKDRKPFEIQASIDYVKEWKFRNQTSMLETKAISIVMQRMEKLGEAYDRGLKADKVIHVDRETGKVKTHPDFAMQLKTAAEVRMMMEATQPKTPGVAIQNNIGFGASSSGGPGMSFEQVLRKKRDQLGLANEQEVDVIEGELSQEDEIAKEFEDFGGDDDGEDEEGDDDGSDEA